ncbi:MAG: hypothetical protein EBU08_17770, partial [Micrococcales bacterium]|nr:hypothetical protein [Micrococcales bacterium]
MAANQPQSYAETLREMRNTRMQQLRQGNSQAQIMNRQIAVLSSMNNMIAKQTLMMSRLESSQRSSNQQLVSVNKNLTNLSTSLTRSLSNFAASVTRSAGKGIGGAVAGTASAAGSIASSLASGIGNVLPAAIAGYVVKSVAWDNMSQATRDRISGSMGSLFNKAFKEIDSTELGHTLTKALTPAISKISDAVSAISDKIPSGRTVVNSAKETAQAVRQKLEDPDTVRNATTAGLMTRDVAGAVGTGVRTLYDLSQSAGSIPEGAMTAGKVALGTLGVGAAYLGGKELLGGSSAKVPSTSMSSSPPPAGTFKRGSISIESKKAVDLLKNEGSKVTKANVVMARTFNAISKLGSAAKTLLVAIKESKIKTIGILGLVIKYGFLWVCIREIDSMV